MVSLKQIRAKRSQVTALQAALEAAQLAHQECVAELTHAADHLKATKDKWVAERDKLEELGREFALDEGENDFTPPMTFEPPPVQGLQGKILTFPASVLESPTPNVADPESTTISKNKNGVWVKEYMGPNGNMNVMVLDSVPDEIEGNLSIGPDGTPILTTNCTCGGSGGYDGKIDPNVHAPQCPAYPVPVFDSFHYDFDKSEFYVVKRKAMFADKACCCAYSQKSDSLDGQPCTYHKMRGEFCEIIRSRVLFWPLQEVDQLPGVSDDEIPF